MYEASAISPILGGVLGSPHRGKLPRLRKKKKNPLDDDDVSTYTNRRGTSVATTASTARSVGSYYSVTRSNMSRNTSTDPMAFLKKYKGGNHQVDKAQRAAKLRMEAERAAARVELKSKGELNLTNVSLKQFHVQGYSTGDNAFRDSWEAKLKLFASSEMAMKTKKLERAVIHLQTASQTPLTFMECVCALADGQGSQNEALGNVLRPEYVAEIKMVTSILDIENIVLLSPRGENNKMKMNRQKGVLERNRASVRPVHGKISVDPADKSSQDLPHFGMRNDNIIATRRGSTVKINSNTRNGTNLDFALEDPSAGHGLPVSLARPLVGASPPVGGLLNQGLGPTRAHTGTSQSSVVSLSTNQIGPSGRRVSFGGTEFAGIEVLNVGEDLKSLAESGRSSANSLMNDRSNSAATNASDLTTYSRTSLASGKNKSGPSSAREIGSAAPATDIPINQMTNSLRLSSAIDSLLAEKPTMVVMSRRDAYRAYEDSMLYKSPMKRELARGRSVLDKTKKKAPTYA
jgi:hypothetical protein